MGRIELAANEFRITQTEDKLRRENVHGEQEAIIGLSLIAETATLNAMKGLFKTLETEQMLPGTPWVAEPPFRVPTRCLRAVTSENPKY